MNIHALITNLLSGQINGTEQSIGLPRLDGNALRGYFRTDSNCFYAYTIVPETCDLEFERVNPKDHSYLVGYYVGDVADVVPPEKYGGLIYSEAARLDAKRCPNSTPCGDGCIPRGRKCKSKLGVRQQRTARKVRQGVSGADLAKVAGVATAGAVVGAAAGVGAGVAMDKVKQRREERERKEALERRRKELEEAMKERRSIKGRVKQVTGAATKGAVHGGLAGGVAGAGVGSAVGAAKELVSIGAEEVGMRSKRKSVKTAARIAGEVLPDAVEGTAGALRGGQNRREAIKGVARETGRAALRRTIEELQED